MRIEDAIQQKKFSNEFHKAAVNMMFTAAWLNYQHEAIFRDFDITGPQFNLLRILRGHLPEPCTVNLLIERMMDKSSNASRLVDKLVQKKLASRNPNKEDKRAVDVHITTKGLKLLSDIDKKGDEMLKPLRNLTKSEAVQLNILLDKLKG